MEQVQPAKIFPTTDVSSDQLKTQKTIDGFQNFAARLGVGPARGECGTEDNLLSKGHYEPNLITRNRMQLEWAYRGSWIVGQVIDTIPKDMTRAGVSITTNEQAEVIPDLKTMISQLQIMTAFSKTIRWGRLYGGAVGIMQIEGQDLSKPLSIDSVGKDQFKGITVYDRWQIMPSLTELIRVGPDMGLPKFYDIVSGTNINDPGAEPMGESDGQSASGRVRVHHSRLFRMIGIELPFFQAITEMLWGESVLERMWDRLIAFDDATMNTVGLIHRANLRTVGIEGLREILAAGGEAQRALEAQFEMMRQFQSNEGITLLDKLDEFASTSYSFAGLPDTLIQVSQQVSGAAEIPLVALFGQSPAGMNATGEADIRLYYDRINAKQEFEMRNPFDKVLRVMWRSLTGKPSPKDLAFTFTPLWQMSAKDKADVAKANVETILAAHQEGAIDLSTTMLELKQNSSETGLFTHITDEAIADAENDEPPAPENEVETEVQPKVKEKPTGDSIWSKGIKLWLSQLHQKPPVLIVSTAVKAKAQVSDDRKRIADWMAKDK